MCNSSLKPDHIFDSIKQSEMLNYFLYSTLGNNKYNIHLEWELDDGFTVGAGASVDGAAVGGDVSFGACTTAVGAGTNVGSGAVGACTTAVGGGVSFGACTTAVGAGTNVGSGAVGACTTAVGAGTNVGSGACTTAVGAGTNVGSGACATAVGAAADIAVFPGVAPVDFSKIYQSFK